MRKLVFTLLAADITGLALVATERAPIPGLILIGVAGVLVLAVIIAAVRREKILSSSY